MQRYLKRRKLNIVKPEQDKIIHFLCRAFRGHVVTEVCKKTYIRPGTVYKIQSVKTKRQQHLTVVALLEALGYEYKITRKE